MPVESLHENPLPKSAQKYVELRDHRVHEEGIANSRPWKGFRESHKKPETYKHHDVNILISRIPAWIESFVTIVLVANKDTIKYDYSYLDYQQGQRESFDIFQVMLLAPFHK